MSLLRRSCCCCRCCSCCCSCYCCCCCCWPVSAALCACVWRIFSHVATCYLQVRLGSPLSLQRCIAGLPDWRQHWKIIAGTEELEVHRIAFGVADYVVAFGGCVNLWVHCASPRLAQEMFCRSEGFFIDALIIGHNHTIRKAKIVRAEKLKLVEVVKVWVLKTWTHF